MTVRRSWATNRESSSPRRRQRPELGNIFTSFDPNYPQVKVDLDREKARTLGVPVNEVFQAMSTAMGGAFVNDFNRFGELYRVYVQAQPESRLKSEDIGKHLCSLKTTNQMIPLSTLVTVKDIAGTELTTRFNLLRSVEIQGAPATGYTSGQALAALEAVFAETMPKEMSFAYSSIVLSGKDCAAAWADIRRGDLRASFCCSPRCTRAGVCPGPFCSARRWWPWARCSASGCSATTTTSTCRSVSSC